MTNDEELLLNAQRGPEIFINIYFGTAEAQSSWVRSVHSALPTAPARTEAPVGSWWMEFSGRSRPGLRWGSSRTRWAAAQSRPQRLKPIPRCVSDRQSHTPLPQTGQLFLIRPAVFVSTFASDSAAWLREKWCRKMRFGTLFWRWRKRISLKRCISTNTYLWG